MLTKSEIRASISCYDYVLRPKFKKTVRLSKDSPFYSLPPKPAAEAPAPLRVNDSLVGIVDGAGIKRVEAICRPEIKAEVVKKLLAMARVRNQPHAGSVEGVRVCVNATHPGALIGFATVCGIIVAVRNALRAPKERVAKSPQGKPMEFHQYSVEELKQVSAVKEAQRCDFEKKLVARHEIYSKQSRLNKSSESQIFFGRRGFETRGIVDGEDGQTVRYTRVVVYHISTLRGNTTIKAGTVREETELKPKVSEYRIVWVETALTSVRVRYTGVRVAPSNREAYHTASLDDYKFGEKDNAEFFEGW